MQTNNENTPLLIRLDETDSTNRYLQQLLAKRALPEGSLVVADFQTAGKGQVGNSWEAERGANLLFSLLLRPDFLPANRQFLISQIASLSVKETLEAAYLRHRHRPERQPAMFPKRRPQSCFTCTDHRAATRSGRGVATFPAHLLRLLHPSASGRRGRHPANVQRSIVSRRRLLSLCRQGGNV